jgi:hypothetical protein
MVVSAVVIAATAAGSATPFSCGTVSFVIVENLEGMELSETVQSEGWSGCSRGIRHGRTTSFALAPLEQGSSCIVCITDAKLAARIALARLDFIRVDHWIS